MRELKSRKNNKKASILQARKQASKQVIKQTSEEASKQGNRLERTQPIKQAISMHACKQARKRLTSKQGS